MWFVYSAPCGDSVSDVGVEVFGLFWFYVGADGIEPVCNVFAV